MIKDLFSIKNAITCAATVCFTGIASQGFAQFTPGNVVVFQAGDGSTTLASTGNPIVLKEFTPTGTPAFSLAIPTSSTTGLVVSGTATSEGLITRSANGQQLVFGGYATTYSASVVTANGTVVPRGIITVNAAGTYSRVATSTTFFSGNNIRGAASDGLNNFWASGGNQGTNYFGATSTPTLIQSNVTNTRAIDILGGSQLAFSTGSGTTTTSRGIFTIGSGAPTTASSASIAIATGTASSPYQFCISPTFTVGYIADDNSVATGGGIQKWTFNGTFWTLAYTFATSTNTAITVGARGVTADFSGPNPIIYATTAETSSNRLISIIDGGSVGSSTITTLATATTSNTIFRGIALSPVISCTAPAISSVTSNAPICSGQSLVLQSNVTGTAPLTYSWTGTGSFSSTSAASPTVTGAASGNYVLTVTNACGTATAAVNATVNPTPVVSVNAASICSGGSATLTANGATSYSWSPASNLSATTGSVVISNPTSTTIYTVVGSTGSCSVAASTTVSVIASPTLTVNSLSICAGSSTTLSAGGVSTYTWTSPASNSMSIAVTPSATTVYTVSGNASGCAGTFSATGTVSVNPLPSVVSTSASICAGKTTTLTASGTAVSYSWNPSGVTTNTIAVAAANAGLFTFTVTGTSAFGCSNSTTTNLIGLPNPTINITATPSVICIGQSVTLTASGASTYTWTGGVVNGTAFSPTTTANYSVTGTSAIGSCTATAAKTVTVNTCTGIKENSNSTVLTIYPNPSNGNFTIQSSVYPATLIVYDVTGKQVVRKEITEAETLLTISQLDNGIYYLNLSNGNATSSSNYKIVIAK